MISPGMDQYLDDELVPAQTLHDQIRRRYGDAYRTPGYYLRLYRLRASLTQAQLACQAGIRQRHLSEMENNKRSIDKTLARKLAHILDFDYRKLR
jgi:DNA-binding XRE family transcriptional regulator